MTITVIRPHRHYNATSAAQFAALSLQDRRKPSGPLASADPPAEQDRPRVLVPSLCQAPAIGGISDVLSPGCRELVMFPDEGDQAERQFWIGLEFRVSSEMETQQIKGKRWAARTFRGGTAGGLMPAHERSIRPYA